MHHCLLNNYVVFKVDGKGNAKRFLQKAKPFYIHIKKGELPVWEMVENVRVAGPELFSGCVYQDFVKAPGAIEFRNILMQDA